MGDSNNDLPKKKRIRRSTSLKWFLGRRPSGHRYRVDFDSQGDPIGPYADKFKSYLGVVARTKVSILLRDWTEVDSDTKKLVWDQVLEIFDVPDDEEFKESWWAYIGLCWKQFKTRLTNTYVFGKGDKTGETTPFHKYSCISTETWTAFVKSRLTPEFVEKRESAKKSQSHNKYYHTTGRYGYKKLKQDMKEDQVKKVREESGDPDLEVVPTSPERHELWKAAHKKKSGSYVTKESESVASKIDEFVDLRSQGSFVPKGKNDILSAAIGKPDHPGRARTAGRGVGLKEFFGGSSRGESSRSQFPMEMMELFEKKLEERVRNEVAKQMAAAGNCGQNAAVQVPSHISTLGSKGSCSPSHMEEPVETDWLREIVVKGYDDGNLQIKLEYEDDYCYVSFVELSDMASGERCLELSHLAIWCTYLHRLCAERSLSDLYGFICPYKITLEGRSSSIVSANIRNRMVNNKKVYLAPFCNEGHWQLIVLVPEQNYVVWMCSLSKKPTKKIKEMINNAMDSRVDTRWLFPKVARQQNRYHCGYFVMKYMITIVNASITDSWEEVFDNTKAYTHEEILEVRKRWAEFYMKIRPVGSH